LTIRRLTRCQYSMLCTQRHSPPSDWAQRHLSFAYNITAFRLITGRMPLKSNNEDDDRLSILTKAKNFYVQFGSRCVSRLDIRNAKERSASRGRANFSTGRGGIGNIRQSSLSRDTRPDSGPDDFSVTRGREPIATQKLEVFSTGRGGMGNLRSPSRDVHKTPIDEIVEEDVIREYKAAQEGAPVSSGRGGIGNISRSRSRDPVSNKVFHSTGRGGAGNIVPGDGFVPHSIDHESDLVKHHATDGGYHSTGRGGIANLTSAAEPAIEHHAHVHNEYESTGRGGAGNIVKERSVSRTRD